MAAALAKLLPDAQLTHRRGHVFKVRMRLGLFPDLKAFAAISTPVFRADDFGRASRAESAVSVLVG
jgi:hypothetical protein